jgi:hypothetical protein
VLSGLAREVQGDPQLAARIRAKYKIKNTVSRAAVLHNLCQTPCGFGLCCKWYQLLTLS